MRNKTIYLDNAATTMIHPEVVGEMTNWINEYYNPSSSYNESTKVANKIYKVRKAISNFINCNPDEVYFTSCGSESNNWAIRGSVETWKQFGNHIITTNIEHHSVLTTFKYLERNGFEVTYLPVDKNGIVNVEELRLAIRDDTILISVMAVNNEIGTIQPIKEIGEIAKDCMIPFHVDATQAIGHIPIDVEELNVDMLTFSGHKIHAPKGIGCLYIRESERCQVDNLIYGGKQEYGKRAGTENVLGIIGLGKAIEIVSKDFRKDNSKILDLRNKLVIKLLTEFDNASINGSIDKRVCGNVNVGFEGINGTELQYMLNKYGICVSTGSACNSGSKEPSHVLKAIGLSDDEANSSIRITLSKFTTEKEIDELIRCLKDVLPRLQLLA